jgi:hypothetical protein
MALTENPSPLGPPDDDGPIGLAPASSTKCVVAVAMLLRPRLPSGSPPMRSPGTGWLPPTAAAWRARASGSPEGGFYTGRLSTQGDTECSFADLGMASAAAR